MLYQTDRLPCDIDGDGKISEHFMVAGMDTGLERFNPEWLFKVPGKIEGPTENVRGEKIISFALTNVREAYGLDLEYLKDSDGDGFPDVIDPEPLMRGFRDGERVAIRPQLFTRCRTASCRSVWLSEGTVPGDHRPTRHDTNETETPWRRRSLLQGPRF